MWNYIRFWEIVFSTFFSRNKDNARISSYVQKLYCRLQIYILPTLSSILAVIFLFEVSLQGCLLQTKFLWQDKCHKKIEFFHLVHYVFVCKSSLIYFAQTRPQSCVLSTFCLIFSRQAQASKIFKIQKKCEKLHARLQGFLQKFADFIKKCL